MMAEAMLNEASDVSRVMFAADYNSALALMHRIYQTKGGILDPGGVKARDSQPAHRRRKQSNYWTRGRFRLDWAGHKLEDPQVILTAIGSYQSGRSAQGIPTPAPLRSAHSVVYMLEPGRFRIPAMAKSWPHAAAASQLQWLYPSTTLSRIFVTHTRPEPMAGTLQPLHTGYTSTRFFGLCEPGGHPSTKTACCSSTRCTWAHVLAERGSGAGSLPWMTGSARTNSMPSTADGLPQGVLI